PTGVSGVAGAGAGVVVTTAAAGAAAAHCRAMLRSWVVAFFSWLRLAVSFRWEARVLTPRRAAARRVAAVVRVDFALVRSAAGAPELGRAQATTWPRWMA